MKRKAREMVMDLWVTEFLTDAILVRNIALACFVEDDEVGLWETHATLCALCQWSLVILTC